MNKIKSNKGFTIIEVVLVLAIAGLIFLMVFVALPNLQRSQRDTQRRDDYAGLASNIAAYISNNGGRLPTIPAGHSMQFDASMYINSDGKSADTEYYELYIVDNTVDGIPQGSLAGTANTVTTTGRIPMRGQSIAVEGGDPIQNAVALPANTKTTKVYVVEKADCGDSYDDGTAKPRAITSAGDRKFAILGALESGAYCQAE